jgi:hypothetical protein
MVVGIAAMFAVAATSYDSSQQQNNTIRDETTQGANDATRVGNALNGILDAAILEVSSQSADFTAAAGFAYSVDTSTVAITVTAPVTPDAGDIFQVVDLFGQWATRNATVDFGTIALHNQVTPNNLYIGNGNYASRTFRYDGTRWLIIQ